MSSERSYLDGLPRPIEGCRCQSMDDNGFRCKNDATIEKPVFLEPGQETNWVSVEVCEYHATPSDKAKARKNTKPEKVDYMLTGHKCKKIAEVDTRLADRKIWLGKLTEPYQKEPRETHCLHIKTPEKEIVLGVCAADSWWLLAMGQLIHQNDKGKLITIDQQQVMMNDMKGK